MGGVPPGRLHNKKLRFVTGERAMRIKTIMIVVVAVTITMLTMQNARAAIYTGGPGANYAMGQMSADKPVFTAVAGTLIIIR
jgi:hypothetical protein